MKRNKRIATLRMTLNLGSTRRSCSKIWRYYTRNPWSKTAIPFTKKIFGVQLNPYFIAPMFTKLYDGGDDLVVHVRHYVNRIEVVYTPKAYICHYFE